MQKPQQCLELIKNNSEKDAQKGGGSSIPDRGRNEAAEEWGRNAFAVGGAPAGRRPGPLRAGARG
jgi:hypothetical protein